METKINQIIDFAKNGNLDNPQIISEYIVRLAAFMWQSGQNILEKEIIYSKKWNEKRLSASSDKQTDQLMKVEAEWREFEEAKLIQRTILQTLQAFKKRLATLSEEWQNTNNI